MRTLISLLILLLASLAATSAQDTTENIPTRAEHGQAMNSWRDNNAAKWVAFWVDQLEKECPATSWQQGYPFSHTPCEDRIAGLLIALDPPKIDLTPPATEE